MTTGTARRSLASQVSGFIQVEAGERGELAPSFAMFFCVLASYMTIRPLRETLGAGMAKGGLESQFAIVLAVMILMVPVFGAISTALPRRAVLPVVYGFFIANLVAFAVLMRGPPLSWLASVFFVWVSVYNLFVVSLFWSQMAGRWESEAGKRLFGIIAAGGTLGSIAGPAIAGTFAKSLGTENLPLVSAAFLGLALILSFILSGIRAPDGEVQQTPPLTLAAVLDGAVQVARQPYLVRIALVVLLANLVSTVFYLEQSRLVKLAIADSAERVTFFASRDFAVSVLTACIQLVGTAWLIQRFGLTLALAALPAVCIGGVGLFSLVPTLGVVSAIMVAERVSAFALAVPAMRVLYTVVAPDEKYKAQNFIDTVVYRAGDAASGLLSHQAGALLLIAVLPFAGLWLIACAGLGAMHRAKAGEDSVT